MAVTVRLPSWDELWKRSIRQRSQVLLGPGKNVLSGWTKSLQIGDVERARKMLASCLAVVAGALGSPKTVLLPRRLGCYPGFRRQCLLQGGRHLLGVHRSTKAAPAIENEVRYSGHIHAPSFRLLGANRVQALLTLQPGGRALPVESGLHRNVEKRPPL